MSGALLGVDAGADAAVATAPIGIRVRAPDSVRYDPQQLAALPVVSPATGAAAPLGTLASFAAGVARAELLRENQQQMIDDDRRRQRPLARRRHARREARCWRRTPPPAGIRVELAGQYASQQAAFRGPAHRARRWRR